MLYRVPYEFVTLTFSLGYALSITFLLSVGLHIRAKKLKTMTKAKPSLKINTPMNSSLEKNWLPVVSRHSSQLELISASTESCLVGEHVTLLSPFSLYGFPLFIR